MVKHLNNLYRIIPVIRDFKLPREASTRMFDCQREHVWVGFNIVHIVITHNIPLKTGALRPRLPITD